MNVILVSLGIYSREGGMERFNRRLIRCLGELGASGCLKRAEVLALWDSKADGSFVPPGVRFVPGQNSKLRTLVAFVWLLLRSRPDVVLCGHVLLLPLLVLAALLRRRCGRILFVHGIEVWSRPPALTAWIVRRCVDCIVTVSRFTASRMATSYGLASEAPFRLLANAVDLPAGESACVPSVDLPGSRRLLTVARLSRADVGKNVDKVILALPGVLKAFPDTHYYVVGEGDRRPELQALAREAGVAEHVHLLGRVDDRRRDAIYASCHVFVLPSSKEGFGIVFLEAWQHGLPVIAGNQDAASEVVSHGVDGLCVSPEPDRITEAICSLLKDPVGCEAMGAAGRRKVADCYGHERFRDTLRCILDGVDGRHEE